MIQMRNFLSFEQRVRVISGKPTAAGGPAAALRLGGPAGLRTRGMRVTLLWLSILAVIPAHPLFAARTILYFENECCRYITEGEFAILYVTGLKLEEPAQGWTVQSAAAALSSLGHQPQGGWVLSRLLSEAVMARLLKNSPFYRSPFSVPDFQKSDNLVTIANARGAVPGDGGLTQGEFAVFLADALKLTAGPSGWSVGAAVAALSRQPVPIQPAGGWKASARLREGDMLQILAPTNFRPASLDPNMMVSTLQAYSLLFGKFEIATEGHFGLFVVTALGVPAPPGGWTQEAALDYIKTRFDVDSGYGWSAYAPLCAETFDHALRKIMAQLQPTVPPSLQTNPVAARSSEPVPAQDTAASAPLPKKNAGGGKNAGVEDFLNSIRHNGLIPADPCSIIPAQGLLSLKQGEPLCTDCTPPPPPTPVIPRPF